MPISMAQMAGLGVVGACPSRAAERARELQYAYIYNKTFSLSAATRETTTKASAHRSETIPRRDRERERDTHAPEDTEIYTRRANTHTGPATAARFSAAHIYPCTTPISSCSLLPITFTRLPCRAPLSITMAQ